MSGKLVKQCTGCGARYDYGLRQCSACGDAGYSAHREGAVRKEERNPTGEQACASRTEETQAKAKARSRKAILAVGLLAGACVALLAIGLALSQGGTPSKAPPADCTDLSWDDLHRGQWPPGGKARVTRTVAALAGRPVHVRGFLLPLHQAVMASEFFLAQRPGACPFCYPPSVSDVVVLATAGGKKRSVTDLPVDAYGTLLLATGGPTDQALYAIHDATIVVNREGQDGTSR